MSTNFESKPCEQSKTPQQMIVEKVVLWAIALDTVKEKNASEKIPSAAVVYADSLPRFIKGTTH